MKKKETIVLVAAPTYGPLLHATYANHVSAVAKWAREMKVYFATTTSMTFEAANNQLVETAKKLDVTHILFLEHDNLVPMSALPRLLSHDVDIVTGWYTLRRPPFEPVPLIKYTDGIYYKADLNKATEDLTEVDIGCFGCSLIKMSVFDSFEKGKSIFKQVYDAEKDYTKTHDVVFFGECKEKGFKIFVDKAVKVGHVCDPLVVTPDNREVVSCFMDTLEKVNISMSSHPEKPAHLTQKTKKVKGKTNGSNLCSRS